LNPLLLYFASGESLYPGVGLLLGMVLTSRYRASRWLNWACRVVIWFAFALIVMSCPPFPRSIAVVFGIVFLLWLISWNKTRLTRIGVRLQVATASILFVLLLALAGVELSHRNTPEINGPADDHLVVLGDSISAGIGTHVTPWPAVLQQTTGVEVKNFSKAGATISDGLAMTEHVSPMDRLILIELGGNDLLAGSPSPAFAKSCEGLLAKLAAPGRTIVMFELPLIPPQIGYGRAQRRLAAKYGVWLIPKRFLAGVIGSSGSTSDGLHLTDAGSARMASMVGRMLSPVLKVAPRSSTTPATHL
jgi:acyl-CoA thioesterase I